MRPNILWIVMDTARLDAFEPYGASAGASPVVADLARRGVAPCDVRSTACWTLPAHASMFAGQLPRALGFADQAGLHPDTARPAVEALRERMLPHVLQRSGYATSAISANLWVSERSGFSVGFDRFVDARSARQARMASPAWRDRLRWQLEVARANADDGARSAERQLRSWIAEPGHAPFFWFVNLVECHSPYLPPRPYGDVSLRGRLKAGAEAREFLTQVGVWRACLSGQLPSEEALERMRILYRGAIRYMDDWLGRLLETLDAAGRLDDTLVLVTSDHGENFGEGNLLAHGFSLDDRLLRVPAVAAGPGAEELRDLRSLGELPARMCAIAQLDDHPYREDDLPPLAVAQFDPPLPPIGNERTQQLISQWGVDETALASIIQPITAVMDGDVKLLLRPEGETFFSLREDPHESKPLAPGNVDAATADRLRAAAAHPAATLARTTWTGAADPQPAAAPQDVADLEDRMRLLGYL